MNIKQFNGSYVAPEDRLMFRFNTSADTEYRLWITRSIAKQIISNSQAWTKKVLEEKHEPKVAKVIQEFQQQSLQQNANFKASYQAAKELPLGNKPVLVIETLMEKNGNLFSVTFQLASNQKLNIKITNPMLQTMVTLLDKLQDIANWGVGLPKPEEDANSPSVSLSGTTPGPSGILH